MDFHVPRILILDNDETTGSYYILFHLYDFFALSSVGKQLNRQKTISILTEFCKTTGIFRPGTTGFLKQMNTLKTGCYIDKVVVYTNQLDVRDVPRTPIWATSDGEEQSVPGILVQIFNLITDNPVFIDRLYTRPINVRAVNNYPVKDFVRVFTDLYPNRQVNLINTRFLDDMSEKKYIVDSSNSNTCKKSRISIPPYSISLPKNTFSEIVNTILKENEIRLTSGDLTLLKSFESKWLHTNANLQNTNVDNPIMIKLSKKLTKLYKEPIECNKKDERGKQQSKSSTKPTQGNTTNPTITRKTKKRTTNKTKRRTRKRSYTYS